MILVTQPCRTDNGECSDFCFAKREQGVLTRVCGCRYGRKINTNNNHECIDNSQAEPDLTSCNGRFQCRNGRCIPMNYKCDGGLSLNIDFFQKTKLFCLLTDNDCFDNSDEQNCPRKN